MGKVKIKWNSAAFKQILSSSGMRNIVQGRADAIARAAGEGFEADSMQGGYGGGRVIGFARSTTYQARRAEAKNKALSKAMDARG